ncbi:MAG: tetratricopeptide repeat protein [Planctomycetes bacterium]|nr:tetratricopeptide repeat protein [Planctomycetota bacterium]
MIRTIARILVRYAEAAHAARPSIGAGARALSVAARLAPGDAAVAIEYARRDAAAGRAADAEARLRAALAKDTKNPELMVALGRLLINGARIDEGLQILQNAVAADARPALATHEFAAALGAAGRFAQALPLAQKVLESRGDDAELRGYVAFLHYKNGNAAEAARAFESAIGSGRAGDRVYAWHARFLADQNNKTAAVETLRKGLAAHPRSTRILGDYARFLAEQGGAKEAEELLRKSLAIDPGDTLALATLGSMLTRGNSNEGEVFYRYALSIDPAHEPSLEGMLKCCDRDGRVKEALLYLRAAVKHKNVSAAVLCLCASRFVEYHENGDARSALALAAEREPGNPTVAIAYADVLLEFNEPADAEKWYQRALAAAASDPRVLARVAASRLRLGKINDAAALAERALAVDPRCVDAMGVQSGALAARGRFADALAIRKVTIQIRPDDAAAHLDCADLLARLDRTEDAQVELQVASGLDSAGRLLADYAAALLGEPRAGYSIETFGEIIQKGRGGARLRFVYSHLLASLGRREAARAHLAAALEASERAPLDSRSLAEARARVVAPVDPEFARMAGGAAARSAD